MSDVALESELRVEASALDERLRHCLDAHAGAASRLDEAMAYSLMAGGKRLRPVLCLWTYDSLQPHRGAAVWSCALALEMVHTYSLIHDDLPAMDDDDLRRGRPSCHRQFDEATAILAGDSLQSEAFELLGAIEPPPLAATAVTVLARAIGRHGMAGGQQLDLDAGGEATPANLEGVHHHKTGALLGASLALGGATGGLATAAVTKLYDLGVELGIAFQIVDDVLDETAPAGRLGKSPGKDRAQGKLTALRLHDPAQARTWARKRLAHAQAGLREMDLLSERLEGLTSYLVERER